MEIVKQYLDEDDEQSARCPHNASEQSNVRSGVTKESDRASDQTSSQSQGQQNSYKKEIEDILNRLGQKLADDESERKPRRETNGLSKKRKDYDPVQQKMKNTGIVLPTHRNTTINKDSRISLGDPILNCRHHAKVNSM